MAQKIPYKREMSSQSRIPMFTVILRWACQQSDHVSYNLVGKLWIYVFHKMSSASMGMGNKVGTAPFLVTVLKTEDILVLRILLSYPRTSFQSVLRIFHHLVIPGHAGQKGNIRTSKRNRTEDSMDRNVFSMDNILRRFDLKFPRENQYLFEFSCQWLFCRILNQNFFKSPSNLNVCLESHYSKNIECMLYPW